MSGVAVVAHELLRHSLRLSREATAEMSRDRVLFPTPLVSRSSNFLDNSSIGAAAR